MYYSHARAHPIYKSGRSTKYPTIERAPSMTSAKLTQHRPIHEYQLQSNDDAILASLVADNQGEATLDISITQRSQLQLVPVPVND